MQAICACCVQITCCLANWLPKKRTRKKKRKTQKKHSLLINCEFSLFRLLRCKCNVLVRMCQQSMLPRMGEKREWNIRSFKCAHNHSGHVGQIRNLQQKHPAPCSIYNYPYPSDWCATLKCMSRPIRCQFSWLNTYNELTCLYFM